MITAYQYKVLRYIRRRKTCPIRKLKRKFGDGISVTLEDCDKYLDYKSTVTSGNGYICLEPDGNYSLSEDGHAAMSEYHYTFQLKTRDAVLLAVISAALGALFSRFVTFVM